MSADKIQLVIQIPLAPGLASCPLFAADGSPIDQIHVDMEISREDAQRLYWEFQSRPKVTIGPQPLGPVFRKFIDDYYEPAIAHLLATLKEEGKL